MFFCTGRQPYSSAPVKKDRPQRDTPQQDDDSELHEEDSVAPALNTQPIEKKKTMSHKMSKRPKITAKQIIEMSKSKTKQDAQGKSPPYEEDDMGQIDSIDDERHSEHSTEAEAEGHGEDSSQTGDTQDGSTSSSTSPDSQESMLIVALILLAA